MGIPEYLLSEEGCEKTRGGICYGDCVAPVKRDAGSGRWYITMGHPGFNTYTNNRNGYVTQNIALAIIRKYGASKPRQSL